MPLSELLQLAKSRRYDDFEARCLELLEGGRLALADLASPLEELERAGQASSLPTLVQMVFENVPPDSDPPAALRLVRVALNAAPDNDELCRVAVDLYRRVYGQVPHFEAVLEMSGLAAGRAVRNALRIMDLCLCLQPGDTLVGRTDGRVVELTAIDRDRGLFTLRQEGRTTTVPAAELAREYDRVAADDFRVLQQLHPERLAELIRDDPVSAVLGLIHAHGGAIDADVLKHEMVPRYMAAQDWSRWWTRARNLLKRCPHVIIQGRAPVTLTYCAEGRTLEDQTWQTLQAQTDPLAWMATVEGYFREKASRKEAPDQLLVRRLRDHAVGQVAASRSRRPAEALTWALIIDRLTERGLPTTDELRTLAVDLLREIPDPARALVGVEHEDLRQRGMQALRAARPQDWARWFVACLPSTPAGLLDMLTGALVEAGELPAVQSFIDLGLTDPVHHPELIYWLWKGPERGDRLRLPSDDELLRVILDALDGLGRTLTAPPTVVRQFRQRMKAALTLHDYQKVRQCLARATEEAAVTIRHRLERLQGLGTNAKARMLDLLREFHPRLWAAPAKPVAPWEDPFTIWCTSEGLRRRIAERDEIVNVKMPLNARRIGEAASHGDLSENSEYKFALEERDLLRARVAAINDELSRARTLEPLDVPTEYVGIGSRVTLRRLPDGQERVMTFLGPFEADVEHNIYSYRAPLSQKLMGRRPGERVTLTLDGCESEFEVVAIANGVTGQSG